MSPPSIPSSRTRPRPTVVLPEPDSPTRPSVRPATIENDTSWQALTTFCSSGSLKYLLKPSTSMIGASGTGAPFGDRGQLGLALQRQQPVRGGVRRPAEEVQGVGLLDDLAVVHD